MPMSLKEFMIIMIIIGFQACGPSEQEKISEATALLQNGHTDEALVLLDEIIDNNANNQAAYNIRGIAKLEKGRIEEAIADLDFSIALDRNDYRAYYNRGNAYYQIENFSEAIRDFDAAVKLQPKEPDIYINRGNALVQLENYPKAIHDYSFALKLDTGNYLTHFNLARAYYLMDSLELARVSFEHCVQIYGTFAPAYYFLGMIALEKNQVEASCLLFQKASDLGYRQAEEVQKLYCNQN